MFYEERQPWQYYEAHVTIEPVYASQLVALKKLAVQFEFHVATLLMRKSLESSPELSRDDTFMSARDYDASRLRSHTLQLVKALQAADYIVWRYKIEDTMLDSRYDDDSQLLIRSLLPAKELHPRKPV